MSHRVHWTEEQLEARLRITRVVGSAAQAENDACHIMALAQEKFANGDDQAAGLLRELAKDLETESRGLRKEQAELEAVYKRDFPHGDIDPALEND